MASLGLFGRNPLGVLAGSWLVGPQTVVQLEGDGQRLVMPSLRFSRRRLGPEVDDLRLSEEASGFDIQSSGNCERDHRATRPAVGFMGIGGGEVGFCPSLLISYLSQNSASHLGGRSKSTQAGIPRAAASRIPVENTPSTGAVRLGRGVPERSTVIPRRCHAAWMTCDILSRSWGWGR